MERVDIGQTIGGKYVLVGLLGVGGMGEVWLAQHQGLHQPFALKVMVPPRADVDLESAETSLRRFEREAQIAAALSRKSRHIAQVIDYGIDAGTAYLVMELLDGEGLDARLERVHTLEPAELNRLVAQIAKALAVAHAEGVTHRDLKPANVFLTKGEDGETVAKLLDFGIARMAQRIVRTKENADRPPTRLTVKGLVLGSETYMSPEQAMAESPDTRADVWSLAVLAYEALTGATPFDAPTPEEAMNRICRHDATPLRDVLPGASDALVAVFERAFARSIDARFQTADELASALAAALAPTPKTEVRPARRPRAAPVIAAMAGVALVALGLILGPRLLASRARADTQTAPLGASAPSPAPSAVEAPAVPSAVETPPAPSAVASAPASSAAVGTIERAPAVRRKAVRRPRAAAPPAGSASAPAPPSVDRSAVF